MRFLIQLIVFYIVFSSWAFAQDKTFGAEEFTLQNGMQVVVIPNHRTPVVTHMVWYKTGAADEKPGFSGMAHYFEHLMFKGTKTLSPGEFSKTVKTLGGRDNAFTGQDYTAYFQSIAVEHLEKVMRMEADRMQNLAPPPEHYASEKQVVLEERRQRTENDPRNLFTEQLRSLLYINHPYATPVIGWMEEIKDYEWEDVKVFYDTWYAPNNAILIVSGDITAETLKPLAEEIYGSIPVKDIPRRSRPKVVPAGAQTLITMHHPSIKQPVLYKLMLAPSAHENAAESLALQVLEDILSGSQTARLYQSLVVDQKKAISADLQYQANALDHSSIWITATPADGVSLAEVESLIAAEIEKVIEDGVTEEEAQESIQRMQDEAIFARDSLAGPAMLMGFALATGSTVEEVENWPRDIATVTPQRVQEVAAKYLSTESSWIRPPVTGYLMPEGGAE